MVVPSVVEQQDAQDDPKAGPGPSTQVYREEKPKMIDLSVVEGQDVTPEESAQYIDRHARKSREHLKTWSVRLRQRWIKVIGEERELPITLKECQLLHHDLLQADEEAFEKIISQEGKPSEVERQDTQEQAHYPTPKALLRVNTKQFKTIFVDPNGRHFITNEEAEKWDKEHYNPKEARLPTLAEIKEEIEKNRLEMIENLPLTERQEYETQKEYAFREHFRSIYHEKGKTYATGAYEVKEVIIKPPYDEIKFLERICDPARLHPSIRHQTTWEAIILSNKNLAYAFNKRQDNEQEYADAPYMPQLVASARKQITDVLKEELRRKDQIKSAIVVYATYVKYKYLESGDISDMRNYEKKYYYPYHRGKQHILLSENDIDNHITKSAGEIDEKIEKYLKEESGKILLRLEMVLIESYTLRRATGGSHIPTPKRLSNIKCTINPDNSDIIDPDTGKPTDNCIKGTLGCYFAHQDGITDHLGRHIYRVKSFQKYLDVVKLDGIPMPTPICPRIFKKIEEMNPDISINV